MYVRLEFKEKNILQLGPGDLMLTDMSVERVIDALSVNQSTYQTRWDRQKWENEHKIIVEVSSPLLGRHSFEAIGLPSDMEAIAKMLEALFAP